MGNADDGQGGVAGKGAGQMGGHTGGADKYAKAVGTGVFGKVRSGGRGAVSAEDVGFVRDTELLELVAGTLDDGPV